MNILTLSQFKNSKMSKPIYSFVKNILKKPWTCSNSKYTSTSSKFHYEIPEVYSCAFYQANASLVQNTNWFVHNALTHFYSELVDKLAPQGKKVLDAIKLIHRIVQVIEPCNNFLDIQFPLKNAQGDTRIIRGFRAEHGVYIKDRPCLGGLRLCVNSESDDIKALAALSTYKYACMGIDMLGAHGGIAVSPFKLDKPDVQKVVEHYIAELTKKGFCGEQANIFEPDINCGSNAMTWIIAYNVRTTGLLGNTCAMGKPRIYGGIRNWEKAVGLGVFFCLDICLENHNIMNKINLRRGWSGKTFVLQGLGNVGYNTALFLEQAKAKCVGIVEHDCHIYDSNGISIQDAYAYKTTNQTLMGFKSNIKCTDPNEVLSSKCDLLVLAATQKSIPYHIGKKIQAKIIVEAANGPISPCLHKELVSRKKLVLPDIWINSGSSIASYLEYTKNLSHVSKDFPLVDHLPDSSENNFLTHTSSRNVVAKRYHVLDTVREKDQVAETILCKMEQAFKKLLLITQLYNLGLDFRTAAYINALKPLFWEAYYNNIK